MTTPHHHIRPAKSSDLDAVVEIAAALAYDGSSQDGGFLISAYDRETYSSFLGGGKHVDFLVATDANGQVAAFLIGYDAKYARTVVKTHTAEEIDDVLGSSSDYYIIKQIGVAPSARRQGLARALYDEIADRNHDRRIFATIVSDPKNEASERFHAQQGFVPLMRSVSKSRAHGKTFRSQIWFDNGETQVTEANNDDKTSLLEAMHHCRALYMHEDNLNWTKIRFLVTVLFALIAAGWALLQLPGWDEGPSGAASAVVLSSLIILAGYTILSSVSRKLRSGMVFLASHKDNLRLVEKRLSVISPGFVTPVLTVPHVAETFKMMKHLPIFAMLAWTAVSLLLGYKIVMELLAYLPTAS